MTLTLPVPLETQAALERRAAKAGVDVPTLILQVINESLEDQSDAAASELPYDRWHDEFCKWLGGHVSRNPQFDDSRDSIYD